MPARRQHLPPTVLNRAHGHCLWFTLPLSVWLLNGHVSVRSEYLNCVCVCVSFHRGQRFRWSSPVKLCTGTLEQQHLIVPLALLLSHDVITPLSSSLLFHSSLLLTAAPNVSLAPSLSFSLPHTRHLVFCVVISCWGSSVRCPNDIGHLRRIWWGWLNRYACHGYTWADYCHHVHLYVWGQGWARWGHLCPLVAGRAPHSYCSLCHCVYHPFDILNIQFLSCLVI